MIKTVKMTADLILSYIVSLLLMFVLATILLATFGWSLGVRRLYVRVLLKIFKVKSFIIMVYFAAFYCIFGALSITSCLFSMQDMYPANI